MDNVIKLTTITVVENTVILPLSRYEELLEKEKLTKSGTIYIRSGFWVAKEIYTDDEAIKNLAFDYEKLLEEKNNLTMERSDLVKENRLLVEASERKLSWRELFKVIKKNINK